MSIMPLSAGKPLMWDTTCSNTFATSYQGAATFAAGEVATHAEVQKETKYSNLSYSHILIPILVESTGVFGPRAEAFERHLG